MLHKIPAGSAGRHTRDMAHAVESCVHCGFCLPACPTYGVLGEEMDSPRGRIILMKQALEGTLSPEQASPFIDRCLGCLACETACPSGVPYRDLITPYRAWAEQRRRRTWGDRLRRAVLRATIPYPGRFRAALKLGHAFRGLNRFAPKSLRPMLAMMPDRIPANSPLPPVVPAEGPRRARVALLAGCAQQVLAPQINAATLRVLAANGVETLIPPRQACCGALALHVGDESSALALAKKNLAAFPTDVDAVVTNAAGCGSGIHEYGLLFHGLPEQPAAEAFAKRTVDVSTFLNDLGLLPPPRAYPKRVAYHDACHLAHAQGVRSAPRRLLLQVQGLTLLEPANADLCCGSAGTYNLEHPDIAAKLGRQKADALAATGAELVATGNIGCLTQIRPFLPADVPVVHTMEVLAEAYGRQTPRQT